MDAVRESIEALGGSVSLSSRRGKGSTVTLRLPLTLAIIEGFIVGVSGETYVLPLAGVIECIDFKRFEELGSASSGIVNLRDNAVPCIRLCHLLGREPSEHGREAIVVIRHGSKEAGIVVDELYGKSQVVIKPLGSVFRDLPCIAGSTILGTGDVALILDIPILLRTSVAWLQGGESQGGQLDAGSLAKRSTELFGEGDERHA